MRTKDRASIDANGTTWNAPETAPGKRALTDSLVQRSAAPTSTAAAPLGRTPPMALVPDQSFLDSIIGSVPAPVQQQAEAPAETADVHGLAAAGIGGSSESLPFLDVIQASFGSHDVSGVQAHTDDQAASAAAGMGASAFATGDHVAFAGSPDLHTAAHEAAHVVQQRAGVQLKGGVDTVGDAYEQQADAVADMVVRGESAEPLLHGTASPSDGMSQQSVQLRRTADALPSEARVQTAEQRQIIEAVQRVQTAEDRAERIWRDVSGQAVTPDAGCTALTAIVGTSMAPVMVLSGLFARAGRDQHAVDEASDTTNPFKLGKAANDADQLAPLTSAVDIARPEVFDSLNNLVRLSLQTMRLASEGGERLALASMVDTLSGYAAPMGWTRPVDVETANERRFAHEACPDGAMDERPDVCTMSDAERVDHRRQVTAEIGKVVDAFFAACDREKAALQAMIDADREIGQFIGGVAVEFVMGAVTGGAGAASGKAAMSATEAVGDAAKATVRRAPDLKKLADKFSKYAGKVGTQKLPGQRGGVPEERTIDAIGQLEAAFRQALDEVGDIIGEFDDLALRELLHTLMHFSSSVAERRVKEFVSAYRTQIEPIGSADPLYAQSQPPGWRDLPAKVTIRAARIHPLRGEPRMALVRQVTDAMPSLRAAGRKAKDVADGGARMLERVVHGQTDQPTADGPVAVDQKATASEPSAAKPGSDPEAEQFHFMRWIDDDMVPLADAEAIDLSSIVVRGLTWSAGLIADDQPTAKE